MTRTDNGEVTPIDSRDLGDAQAFSSSDNRRVHGAKWQIAVERDEFSDPEPVRDRHRFNGEHSTCDIPGEAGLGLCSEARGEEMDDLCDDQGRHDQRARMRLEQLACGSVVGIVSVDVGVQRTGVDDKRGYRATSAARMSSIR